MRRKRVRFTAALSFALALASSPAAAHDLPTNTIMNAFVKIEPRQAQLVVRVPLDLLRGLPFPRKGSQYDLRASGPATRLALLALANGFVFLENGVRLTPVGASGRLSPPSDRSFENYDAAVALADQPPDASTPIFYDLGYFDLHFTYPISSPKSVFKIQAQVAADLGEATKLAVRYLPLDESSRAMLIKGGSEPVALNPAWYNAAGSFLALGIEHILSGIDHLLFLFCLIIPFRRLRGLISVITAFTVAHSVTLFASAFQFAPRGSWFPPFVETAIAASIVYMALENILGADLRRRWLVTGMFGLVHGFGFSYALGQSLQFAGSNLLLSLFSFNVGIEIGQLCVLALILPALALFRRLVPERMLVILLSASVAYIGWDWMMERSQALLQAEWPRLDATGVIGLARWASALLLAFGAALWLAHWVRRKSPQLVGAPERRAPQPESSGDFS
jgi:hydrogenase/urease accessory protein HupE